MGETEVGAEVGETEGDEVGALDVGAMEGDSVVGAVGEEVGALDVGATEGDSVGAED